jgi:hypothetical protein
VPTTIRKRLFDCHCHQTFDDRAEKRNGGLEDIGSSGLRVALRYCPRCGSPLTERSVHFSCTTLYFNWVEPRPFRLSRKFKGLAPTEFDTGHEEVVSAHDEIVRQTRPRRILHTGDAHDVGQAAGSARNHSLLGLAQEADGGGLQGSSPAADRRYAANP